MAKIYGLQGAMTGRLGNTVMAVRNGEQIARKYQPVVLNPSTPAQVAARAKLKELSQLSTVMAPVIAMKRIGAVSKRNMFTKVNYTAVSFSNGTATVNLTSIKITKSVVPLPNMIVTRENTTVTARLQGTSSLDVNRVVYAGYMRDINNELRYIGSKVVTTPGDNNTYEANFTLVSQDYDVIVYAYGVRENSEAARVAFGNITVPTAEMIATLVTTSNLTEADITLTETQAVILAAASN